MKRKTIWWIAVVVYLLIIFRITVFRSDFSFDNLFGGTLNLSLFSEYMRFAQNGSWRVFLYYFLGNIINNIPGNITVSAHPQTKTPKRRKF